MMDILRDLFNYWIPMPRGLFMVHWRTTQDAFLGDIFLYFILPALFLFPVLYWLWAWVYRVDTPGKVFRMHRIWYKCAVLFFILSFGVGFGMAYSYFSPENVERLHFSVIAEGVLIWCLILSLLLFLYFYFVTFFFSRGKVRYMTPGRKWLLRRPKWEDA